MFSEENTPLIAFCCLRLSGNLAEKEKVIYNSIRKGKAAYRYE